MEKNFNSIGEDVKLMKYDYKNRIDKLKESIEINYTFLLTIVEEYYYMFGIRCEVLMI